MTANTKKKKKTRSSQLSDKQRVGRFWMLRRNYQRGRIQGFSRTLVPTDTNYSPSVYTKCREELATLKKWLTLAKVWG